MEYKVIEKKVWSFKPFILGLIVGLSLMFMGSTVYGALNRRMDWGPVDPNTKIEEIYELLNTHSIVPFDLATMIENMYRGLLAGVGDPYTHYFDRASFDSFMERMDGTFVGIGVMVLYDSDEMVVEITRVFNDSPAQRGGLLVSDRIIEVDGENVVGKTQQEVVAFITGDEDTDVTVTVRRANEDDLIKITMTRGRVAVPSVFYEVYEVEEGLVGYVLLDTFNAQTYPQFREAIEAFTEKEIDGLIIDLRNNSGGRLDVVNNITDMIVPEGVIMFMENAAGRRTYHYSGEDYLGLPLVILVNGRSASASELMSGAARDHGVATIVGETTFGKGVVQHTFILSDGSAIQVTTQTYFTPDGHEIQDIGITPDYYVELDGVYSRLIGTPELDFYDDVQLQKALEVIGSKLEKQGE